MGTMIHKLADVQSSSIGDGTRIWQFSVVLPEAVIGRDCITIENDVFLGPNATFTNDLTPRSRQIPEAFLRTTVCAGASIGANATILPGIRIGRHAMIGAGAVVTRNIDDGEVVVGNPARKLQSRQS